MSAQSKVAALVCEGPSDIPVLTAIIQKLWPAVDVVLTLHPEIDQLGKAKKNAKTGWSEVRAWCIANAGQLEFVMNPDIGDPIDLLVIALDVDIAIQAKIENPPANIKAYDASRLVREVKKWLGSPKQRLPREIVIAIPAMAIETWVVAALHPKEKHPEHIFEPAAYLVKKGHLDTGTNGKPLKPVSKYTDFAIHVSARLKQVRERCSRTAIFCVDVLRVRDSNVS